jgi:hypothetical protein
VLLRQRPVGVGGADDPVPADALAVPAAQFSSTVQLIAAGGAGPQADGESVGDSVNACPNANFP